MAIFHLSVSVISRGKGQSAIASAAYRSGDRLVDEQTGESKFYKRSVHPETFIMTPTVAPTWAHDRQRLWNAVEESETRKNSRLAREFNVALPQELSETDQRKLLKDYVQHEFVDQGMIADVAIHRDHPENPHAHVMLTTREISEEGFTNKNRDWNQKEQLEQWREQWSVYTNHALERSGSSARISHESFEKQNPELMPTVHLGHVAAEMEKRGVQTERGNINRAAKEHNAVVVQLDEYRKQKAELVKAKTERQQAAPTPPDAFVYYSDPKKRTAYMKQLEAEELPRRKETDQDKYDKALRKQQEQGAMPHTEKPEVAKPKAEQPVNIEKFKANLQQQAKELLRNGDKEGMKAFAEKLKTLEAKLKEKVPEKEEKPHTEKAKVEQQEPKKAAPLMTVHLEPDEWQAIHQTKAAIGEQPTLENVAKRLNEKDNRLAEIKNERQQKQQDITMLNEAERQTGLIANDQATVRKDKAALDEAKDRTYTFNLKDPFGHKFNQQKQDDISHRTYQLKYDQETLQARVEQLKGQAKEYGLNLQQTPNQVKEQIRGKVTETEKSIQSLNREETVIKSQKKVLEKTQKALYKQHDQPLNAKYGHSLKNARTDLERMESQYKTAAPNKQQSKELERLKSYVNRHEQAQLELTKEQQRTRRRSHEMDGPSR